MKWLLNNWCGRLYLVAQITCLIVTIVLAVNFIKKSYQLEKYAIWETRRNLGEFEYGAKGQLPPQEEMLANDEYLESKRKIFREARRDKAIQYLWPNLAVPLVFLIGLFVSKGQPGRKNAP